MSQNIIEKQQVRGSSASIAKYAGKEGQIVFNKDNKRLHVMSGTAGQSTQYLSTAQAATKTQLSSKLDTATYNSDKANFATNTALTQGLAGKANATHTHATSEVTGLDTALAGKANASHTHGISDVNGLQDALDSKANTTNVAAKTHTHAISDVTNLQTTLDGKAASSHNHDSTYIKISGSRGDLGGYENLQSLFSALTVSNTTRDGCCITGAVKITVNNGSSGQTWTKTIGITNALATVTLGSSWKWVGGSAPTIAANGVLVVHWCGTFGIANFVSPS